MRGASSLYLRNNDTVPHENRLRELVDGIGFLDDNSLLIHEYTDLD